MIKEIYLGPNLRKKIERMAPYARDALFAEEKRMSDELSKTYQSQGVIIDGFYERTGEFAINYFPLKKRKEILNQIHSETVGKDFYIIGTKMPINRAVFPLSVMLDIVQNQNNARCFDITFFDSNKNLYFHGQSELEDLKMPNGSISNKSYFDKLFKHYWYVASLQEQLNLSNLWAKEAIDIERDKVHAFGSKIVEHACLNGLRSSWRINKDFFTFVTHLMPDRDNPFIKILSNKNRPLMRAIHA